jgi:hypothetical protein
MFSEHGFETLDAGNVSGYGEIEAVQRDPQTISISARRTAWQIKNFGITIKRQAKEPQGTRRPRLP